MTADVQLLDLRPNRDEVRITAHSFSYFVANKRLQSTVSVPRTSTKSNLWAYSKSLMNRMTKTILNQPDGGYQCGVATWQCTLAGSCRLVRRILVYLDNRKSDTR